MIPSTTIKSGCVCLFLVVCCIVAACHKEQGRTIYVLEGGDPSIDFINFFSEDSCQFIAPGPFNILDTYTQTDSTVTIHVIEGISSTLVRRGPDTLIGRPPFFDGVWIRTNPF